MALINKLSAIGDAIREKTGKEELIPLEDMPQEIRGIESGGGGNDSYYDTFWDAYQDKGNRIDYSNAFDAYDYLNQKIYRYWSYESFKPKYDMQPTNATQMFNGTQYLGSDGKVIAFDLEARLEELGVKLDFSKCTGLTNTFSASSFSTLPIIDCSACTGQMARTFYNTTVTTIRKLILNRNISYNSVFYACTKLENIIIEGEIGNSFQITSPVLSTESVQSIIDCLVDLTGGTAQTLTLHKDVKAKLTDTQIATITNKNWSLA